MSEIKTFSHTPRSPSRYCSICDQYLKNASQMAAHLKTQKHLRNAKSEKVTKETSDSSLVDVIADLREDLRRVQHDMEQSQEANKTLELTYIEMLKQKDIEHQRQIHELLKETESRYERQLGELNGQNQRQIEIMNEKRTNDIQQITATYNERVEKLKKLQESKQASDTLVLKYNSLLLAHNELKESLENERLKSSDSKKTLETINTSNESAMKDLREANALLIAEINNCKRLHTESVVEYTRFVDYVKKLSTGYDSIVMKNIDTLWKVEKSLE